MMEDTKISVSQFSILVMLFTIGTTILIIPASLAANSKQDAWIAAILGVAFGLLLVLLYNKIGGLFPNMTFVQYNEVLFGKWAGKAVSLLFIFYSFIGTVTLLYYVGNFITTQVMPETPMLFINILFVSIVVMGLRLGIETVARAAEILFPWFVLLFFVLVVFISPQIRFQLIQPIFEAGISPIFKGALSLAATASMTFIVFLMIFPVSVIHQQKAKKAFLKAALTGGGFIIVITALTILVLGPDTTARNLYPSYALAKKISVGNFVERIESLMAAMWFITIYFKMTLYAYGCVIGLAQVINLKDYRPLCLPLGMIFVVYSLVVYPNVNYMAKWDSTIYIPYALTFGLLLPLVLLLASAFRKLRS